MEASDRCCLAGPLTNGQAKPSTPWPTDPFNEGPLRPDHSSPISCAEHTKSYHIVSMRGPDVQSSPRIDRLTSKGEISRNELPRDPWLKVGDASSFLLALNAPFRLPPCPREGAPCASPAAVPDPAPDNPSWTAVCNVSSSRRAASSWLSSSLDLSHDHDQPQQISLRERVKPSLYNGRRRR